MALWIPAFAGMTGRGWGMACGGYASRSAR